MGQIVRLVINEQPHEMAVKEYQGRRVVTLRDIDELHQRPEGTAARNFRTNRGRFIEGTDFFEVDQPDEIRRLGLERPQGGTPELVYVVTEDGYLMLVKSLTDDLAWAVQRELVNGYFRSKPAQPLTEAEMLLQSVQLLVNHEREISQLKSESRETRAEVQQLRFVVDAMGARAQDAEEQLLALPAPTDPVPERTTRATVRRLVDSYCEASRVPQQTAYNILYREVRDRYGKDLKARVRGKKISALEMAERIGIIEQVYALAYELFGPERRQVG